MNANGRTWNKVFEIGVQRTGTSSLGEAFRTLGLKTTGWNERLYWQCIRGGFEETISFAEGYEAFEDLPWDYDPVYPLLDKAYPGSKFIVLDRGDDEWVASYEQSFGIEDPGFALNWKRRKYAAIDEYFAERPQDLLHMNLVGGEGWEVLCPFLGLPEPDTTFPHRNDGTVETPGGAGPVKRLFERRRSR